MERKTRLELATPTLARWCSTTELLPHDKRYFTTFALACQHIILRIEYWAFYQVRSSERLIIIPNRAATVKGFC